MIPVGKESDPLNDVQNRYYGIIIQYILKPRFVGLLYRNITKTKVKTTSLAPRFCERTTSGPGALTAGAALTEVGAATGAWYVVWWRMACHVSSVQNPYDIPLYWLVYRDPILAYYDPHISPYNWVGCHPIYQTTNQGFESDIAWLNVPYSRCPEHWWWDHAHVSMYTPHKFNIDIQTWPYLKEFLNLFQTE